DHQHLDPVRAVAQHQRGRGRARHDLAGGGQREREHRASLTACARRAFAYHRATTRRPLHTMPRTIEFLFDFGSPTTYLAHTQLSRIAADTGARVDYVPMLLGGVFKATGNQSPVLIPAKGRWMGQDIARFAKRYGVPFTFNPHFPINTLTLMRGA